MNENKEAYEAKKVVENYKKFRRLLHPEKIIHSLISKKEFRESMLDIGVGGGRTTEFFSPLFKQYIGIDFSSGMIQSCIKRFYDKKNISFIEADVTSLPDLPIEKFDFILYSLNGISYLRNLNERVLLFEKISYLLKDDGFFVFSAHNAKAIKSLYTFQWPKRNPLKIFSEYIKQKNLRKINGEINHFEGKKFFQIYDGGEYFKALTAYILPSFQISLLKNVGFGKIELLDFQGKNIPLSNADDFFEDRWMIYYICSKY